ncbi:MAG: hypothetical protein ACRD0U_20060 [Acidimicrobiales bacterium]
MVATTLALLLARSSPVGALVVDLAGDVPAVLGTNDPVGPGLADWLAAPGDPAADGLEGIECVAGPGLRLIGRGSGPLEPARADLLAALLATDPGPVVVDCGQVGGAVDDTDVALTLAASADQSLLVLRSCFLALRRASVMAVRPSGVVLVVEDGRAITRDDVESVLGVPVRAQVRVTPQIARAVDAGILAGHLPRTLERDLRHAA